MVTRDTRVNLYIRFLHGSSEAVVALPPFSVIILTQIRVTCDIFAD